MWFGTKFAFKLCKTQLSKINLKFYPKWAMFQKKRGSKRLRQYQKNIFSFFCFFVGFTIIVLANLNCTLITNFKKVTDYQPKTRRNPCS